MIERFNEEIYSSIDKNAFEEELRKKGIVSRDLVLVCYSLRRPAFKRIATADIYHTHDDKRITLHRNWTTDFSQDGKVCSGTNSTILII